MKAVKAMNKTNQCNLTTHVVAYYWTVRVWHKCSCGSLNQTCNAVAKPNARIVTPEGRKYDLPWDKLRSRLLAEYGSEEVDERFPRRPLRIKDVMRELEVCASCAATHYGGAEEVRIPIDPSTISGPVESPNEVKPKPSSKSKRRSRSIHASGVRVRPTLASLLP